MDSKIFFLQFVDAKQKAKKITNIKKTKINHAEKRKRGNPTYIFISVKGVYRLYRVFDKVGAYCSDQKAS